MATTFGQALAKIGASLPDHLIADAEVPVITGVQFQGDKVIMSSTDRFRLSRSSFTWTPENPDINTTALTFQVAGQAVRGQRLRGPGAPGGHGSVSSSSGEARPMPSAGRTGA